MGTPTATFPVQGEMVYVTNNVDYFVPRIFVTKLNEKFCCVDPSSEEDYFNGKPTVLLKSWEYCQELNKDYIDWDLVPQGTPIYYKEYEDAKHWTSWSNFYFLSTIYPSLDIERNEHGDYNMKISVYADSILHESEEGRRDSYIFCVQDCKISPHTKFDKRWLKYGEKYEAGTVHKESDSTN